MTERSPTAHKTTGKENSARKFSYTYYLDLGESKVVVCKVFFLETLGIKEDIVYGACRKKSSSWVVEVDKRGTHGKQWHVPDHVKSDIMEHIESFTPVESHYCRQNTSWKCLPANLSVQKMYKLYKEQCQHRGETNNPVPKNIQQRVQLLLFCAKKRSVWLLCRIQKYHH